ncbi:hypothetical protein F5Y06DRAFT_100325 [Hypoxylon sp. FL0890]|nr:hypothetical protein F5Y06DRAFT_100325 [Hypoxylon sp. FL0890]
MSTANALMKYYHGSSRNFTNIDGQTRNRVFNGIMEAARGEHEWTVIIPEGRLPTLMKKLFRARALYNELSHIRGMPEEDKYKQDGKLAQAIDQWIGSRPVEEPDERYARMHQHIIDYIVDKKIKGERVEWDFAIGDFSGDDSEDDGGNQRWIPWRELWYGKSAKSPSDEDAGWVHNNYFWNEKDDEDGEMTNALLLYN